MKAKLETRTCLACGAEFKARTSPSRNDRGKFCGRSCATRNSGTKHGHSARGAMSPTYNTWVNMVSRCHRPGAGSYSRYGAIGISVCDSWRESFDVFLRDMGERPEGTTLDRIDSSGNYEPGNCRWGSRKEQQRNIRSNVLIEFDGHRECIAWWAERLSVPHSTLNYRIKKWGVERALSGEKPPRRPCASQAPA